VVESSLIGAIVEMEKATGVRPGFFPSLITDKTDDWSYVIKLHALIEAALTHLLTTAANKPEMAQVYALLDTSDLRKGKAAFARGLDLLSMDEIKFVRALSEMRNKFVHDVKNAGMTIEQWYAAMDDNQKKNFVEAVAVGRPRDWTISVAGAEVPLRKFIQENLRLGLWFGALDLLSAIYLQRERLLLKNDYANFHVELLKAYLAKTQGGELGQTGLPGKADANAPMP
jgi:hypothetical protein